MTFKIIGNPPYCKFQDMDKDFRQFLKDKFFACRTGNFDLYYAIIEQCIKHSKETNLVVPNNLIVSNSAKNLRYFLASYNTNIDDLKHSMVFEDADTYSCILSVNSKSNIQSVKVNNIIVENAKTDLWIKKPQQAYNIIVHNGLQTSADRVFIFKEKKNNLYYSTALKKYIPVEDEYIKPIIKGTTLEEFWCLYPYNDKGEAIEPDHNSNCWKYLLSVEKILKDRDYNDRWYNFGRTQSLDLMHKEKYVLSYLLPPQREFWYKKTNALVYSGLFVSENFEEFEKFLKDKDVIEYLYDNGKKMGYEWTSFTVGLLKRFIN